MGWETFLNSRWKCQFFSRTDTDTIPSCWRYKLKTLGNLSDDLSNLWDTVNPSVNTLHTSVLINNLWKSSKEIQNSPSFKSNLVLFILDLIVSVQDLLCEL